MRGSSRLVLWIVLSATLALPAQSNPGLIDLNVVVTPASGPPVSDLKQSDFTVLDNKVPQQITSFHVLGSRDPVRITVVVDAVNVPYTNLAYQREQVARFLQANGGQLEAPTQLAVFTDQGIKVMGDASSDGKELNSILSQQDIGLRDIRRSSQFEAWDRLNLSLNALRSLAAHEAERPGRKMILWLSPGWPLLSGPGVQISGKQQDQLYSSIVALSTGMRQAQIVLYNINPFGAGEGVGRALYYEDFLKPVTKTNQAQLGDLSLQVLALQSGGLTLLGSNDTAGLLEQAARDVRASYQISYVPGEADSNEHYHQIQVRMSKPGLKARTRQGYYVQQP
jgi:VWFA-related protein